MASKALYARERTYSGRESAEFAHDHHQLVAIVEGALRVRNFSGSWTVPPGCAGWIPAGVRHRVEAIGTARVRTLYVRREIVRRGWRDCAALQMTPLMRALINHVNETAATHDAAWRRFANVIVDQLAVQRELPLFLPAIESALAKRIADTLARDPDDMPRTSAIAAALGVSARTIERAFADDVKMTFGEWRQRTRICRAIELLAGGVPVRDVALEIGYETPSAFVAAFKRYVGTTPGKL